MELTRTEEQYLFVMYKIKEMKGFVRMADVAKEFGYSRAASFGLIKKLEAKELLSFDSQKKIILSKEAVLIANKVCKRHDVLKMAFIGLGASEELAEKETFNIECAISSEMIDIIDNHINLHLKELNSKNITLKELEDEIINRKKAKND